MGKERSQEESGVKWMSTGRGGKEAEEETNAARMEACVSWGWEESCGEVVVEVMLVDEEAIGMRVLEQVYRRILLHYNACRADRMSVD